MYLTKTPYLLKKLYPSLIWNFPSEDKSIYLTFDDGPIPEATPFVLAQLKKFNAKATFFCIGDNVRKHPQIYQQILEEGHTVGNHTYNHLNGWKTPDQHYLDNIKKCREYVSSNLFRPPYGRISSKQIVELRDTYKIIMWDVLSGDFDTSVQPHHCYLNVIHKTRPGSIVVFHDSLKAATRLRYTLPAVLKYWSDRSHKFKSIEY